MRTLIQSGLEQRVLAILNVERGRAGCRPLTADPLLTVAARGHSADMAKRRFFAHVTPEGVAVDTRVTEAGYEWSRVGENIAWGHRDARAVMTGWMNSRGHRANILQPDFVHIGIGVVDTVRGDLVWTQAFATPLRED